MSQTDISSPFPEHLKPESLDKRVNRSMRRYAQELYNKCLKNIEENVFPIHIYTSKEDRDKCLTYEEDRKAISTVFDKIEKAGFKVSLGHSHYWRTDYTVITINKPAKK